MTPEDRAVLDQKLADVRQDLLSFLQTLDDAAWQKAVYRDPERWTVSDTVRHLVQAEKSMTRLMDGIRQGHPGTRKGFDLAAFNREGIQRIIDISREELFGRLLDARDHLHRFMDGLSEEDWEKSGRHAIGRVMTVHQICHLIGDHEKGHLTDMQMVVGS